MICSQIELRRPARFAILCGKGGAYETCSVAYGTRDHGDFAHRELSDGKCRWEFPAKELPSDRHRYGSRFPEPPSRTGPGLVQHVGADLSTTRPVQP